MNNLIVAPLLIPLLTAIMLIFFRNQLGFQRWVSGISALLNILIAVILVGQIHSEGIQTLYMGGWLPPYGIVFVADMLAGLLILTASIVGAACLFYSFSSIGEERERMYVYPLVHFLLAGVYGSFLTGDLFNLFVCFEVMLIASYALIVLGGSKRQLGESIKYMLVNILSSALFVTAVAYLYGAVGTLNMAHLSQRVAEAGQGGMLNVIAILLMIVFSLKAGLFLFFWLPGSYAAPPAAIRALFAALLTKVGVYALIRTFSLIFYHDPAVTHTWLGVMAGATMVLGSIGAIAYRNVLTVLNYQVVIGIGFIGLGLAIATPEAWDGVVFYLLHDMLAKVLLFILGGMLIARAGTENLTQMRGLIVRYPLLGWLFLGTALALVGIPPLSGFPGKVLLIRSAFQAEAFLLAAIGLISSFFVLYSLINVFKQAFWGTEPEEEAPVTKPARSKLLNGTILAVFALLVFVGINAEWIYEYVSRAGHVISQPDLYIQAVMKE
ncbi:Na+/H+ antiporter subunit D [Paenibacillus septentrionalis]|uniref:Na+/H+ antiporter subunit D n=1 Tax=Paenibacillus septentrionalis TaxID=429342 RepID=A0ABW1V7G8_9BACL